MAAILHIVMPGPGGRVCGTDGCMLDHLSIQCADVHASAAFYDATLSALGARVAHGSLARAQEPPARRTSGGSAAELVRVGRHIL
jgi:hypothetical protein